MKICYEKGWNKKCTTSHILFFTDVIPSSFFVLNVMEKMANVVAENETPKINYGKVVLSLENCILPTDKLKKTPTEEDYLSREIEVELRILGCELIQTSGILLKLPQVAMATGQVLFQRFYYSKSFVRHTMEVVAMACITLASKIEEAPRRIRDVINVFHHIKQVRAGKNIQPLILDQNYINLKNQVIKAERRVLKELGFCVHVKHPHKIIVTLLELLKVNNPKLTQTAWNYMNDSLRSEVFLQYCPETIACACIYLSARVLQIPLPNKPAWYLVFDVKEEDILNICHIILTLYSFKKPDPEWLEKKVEMAKKKHQADKLNAKKLAKIMNSLSTHSSFSPTSAPTSPKDAKSPNHESKKDKEALKKNGFSPRANKDRENNHRKRKSISPTFDGGMSPHIRKKKSKMSSSDGSVSSESPSRSPRRNKHKTPPRGFKDSRRSRSRSETREIKKSKHRSSHKLKKKSRSESLSPSISPPHKRNSKKGYKSKSKNRRTSRSPTHNHINSHEKSHKSRNKDKTRNSHHSKEKNRR